MFTSTTIGAGLGSTPNRLLAWGMGWSGAVVQHAFDAAHAVLRRLEASKAVRTDSDNIAVMPQGIARLVISNWIPVSVYPSGMAKAINRPMEAGRTVRGDSTIKVCMPVNASDGIVIAADIQKAAHAPSPAKAVKD